MNNIFNICDYGAKGDNKTLNTKFIQKALDEASLCEGKVIVPPGKYLTGPLKINGKGVTIEGSSAWSYRSEGGSIFILADDREDYLLDITGAFGVSIINMNLTMLDFKTDKIIHGIKLYWDKYNGGSEEDTPLIDGCKISKFSGDGIHLEHIWCFRVRHSMLAYNKGNGLFVDGWDGFILDNWFSYNEGYGIKSGNVVASLTITSNRIEWNKLGGFKFSFGDSINITSNFFDRGDEGISLKNMSLVTITSNIFRRPLNAHLLIENSKNITVTSNTSRVGRNDDGGGILGPKYGFIIRNNDYCIISNNTLKEGALKELLVLENNTNSIIENNIGTLTDESFTTGSELLN